MINPPIAPYPKTLANTAGVFHLPFIDLACYCALKPHDKRMNEFFVNKMKLPSYLGICQHANARQTAQTLRHIAWERDSPE
jgi:hypothetical protein